MKVEFHDKDLLLRFPARTWELGTAAIASIRRAPPMGYKVHMGKITPRGRSGTRSNVTVILRHVLLHEPAMDEAEAYDHFRAAGLAAQGHCEP